MRISIRKLHSITTLEQVVTLIRQHTRLDTQVDDGQWPNDEPLRIGFSRVEPEIAMEIHTHEPQNGFEPLRYVFVHAHAEQPKRKRFWFHADGTSLRPREDRLHIGDAHVLFFERDEIVYAAMFTQNQVSLEMLRSDLFSYQWWGDLLEAREYLVDPEFFYWIVRTRMENGGVVAPDLRIEEVSGFDGRTAEDIHHMKGKGDRIYEILSTMAFIFSNDPLDALTMDVQYNQEWLTFGYDRHGGAILSETQYTGRFVGDVVGEHRKGLVVAYLYLYLLPAVFHHYAQANQNWTPEDRFEFIGRTGKAIVRRIATRLGWDTTHTLDELLRQ